MYDVAYPEEVRAPDDPNWLAFSSDPRYADFVARLGIDQESIDKVDWGRVEAFLG